MCSRVGVCGMIKKVLQRQLSRNETVHQDSQKSFLKDESGALVLFVLALLLFTMLFAGMAVDYIRHENARADLQNALDRGILAATNVKVDVTNDVQAKALILEYMDSRLHRGLGVELQITDSNYVNGRSIEARATMALDTIFLKIAGITSLNVPAEAFAIQGLTKTEIALVVDISGSMTWASTITAADVAPDANDPEGARLIFKDVDFTVARSKMDDLKLAASWFVDQVLTADTRDRTLVSIIPYSSQVNLPDSIASHFNIVNNSADYERNADGTFKLDAEGNQIPLVYHNCVAHKDLDFGTYEAIPPVIPSTVISRTTALERDHHFIEEVKDGNNIYGCPKASNAIFPYSNNNSQLKTFINGLEGEHWTATYMGARWAAMLLDPDSSVIVNQLISEGKLAASFNGYPLAWNDPAAKKVLIVMSDGVNTKHRRILTNPYRNNGGGAYYVDPANLNDNGTSKQRTDVIDNEGTVGEPGDQDMYGICEAVKRNPKALVFTIGFEIGVGSAAAQALETCATDSSFAYTVSGKELVTAFEGILASIEDLRLSN